MSEEILTNESYLSFRIVSTAFCVRVEKVLNVIELMNITKVPHSPEYMLGVINLRGEVLPVVDSRIKFGFPITENTINTCIIVLDISIQNEKNHIGMLVDEVFEVFEKNNNELLSPPALGNKFKSEFIKGVFKINNDFVMFIDIDKIFSSDELITVNNMNEESIDE